MEVVILDKTTWRVLNGRVKVKITEEGVVELEHEDFNVSLVPETVEERLKLSKCFEGGKHEKKKN